MKTFIAILGLTLAAMSFAAPSYSADIQAEKKAAHEVAKQQEKAVKEAEKKAAKALAKQKKEQQKAAKKAEKVAKKPGMNPPPQAHAVPEINGSHAVLAISLLAGLIAIRRESRRI
jgi:ferric-dicitrate binding protein FerR (iron transport regulator)